LIFTMTLFEHRTEQVLKRQSPLAARMRPQFLDELVGQDHLLGVGHALRNAIESDQLPSIVLWGPPGTGKTTIANLIAASTNAHFAAISAVTSGVADLRHAVEEARNRIGMHNQRTVLFIDEIHRFNKAQQDVILPHVEDGTVIFIGATTENPSFEVIAPLLSRCRVYTLNPLTKEHISTIVGRALVDTHRGLGNSNIDLAKDALEYLTIAADGDARIALNALDLAASATKEDSQGKRHIFLNTIEDVLQKRALLYDKKGDQHYDTVSAFIKSIRGSDPDAAIYWLARMIEAGEDPLFIVRRLVVLAAEDVGLADPLALSVAVACQQAVHFIGMPEGAIVLAECTVYLATAPKSNASYLALSLARADARRTVNHPVPLHIRNAPTPLMKEMGYGKDYKYAHEYAENFVAQDYLPEDLKGRQYYKPSEQGYEAKIAERLQHWWTEMKDRQ
jgi:putative ATPase